MGLEKLGGRSSHLNNEVRPPGSVRAIINLDASIKFSADECKISRNRKLLAVGKLEGKLYFLKLASIHVNLAKSSVMWKQHRNSNAEACGNLYIVMFVVLCLSTLLVNNAIL